MIALNSAMAEALQEFKKRVDMRMSKGESKLSAIIDVLREDIKTCKPIRFDGNGYSDEWVKEAARRGLDVEKSCPKIIEHYLDDSSVRMFEATKVMNRKELEARNEVKWETYVKTVQIEARVMGDLSMNHIIPVSTHYQSQLIKNVQGMKDVFPEYEANRLSARNMKLIQEIAERTERIEQLVEDLTEARRVANRIYNIHERAIAYHDTVCPKMGAIRYETDQLEMIVEDGLWSLPKYRELLFIR
jgi:glutamine synthetase